ncbi:MAG: GIY-YIG nuclease family protein [Ignavibacteriales bacterium]|nr:GIY-YIG nuclease family protein [Ignavibacteriales bacterium]
MKLPKPVTICFGKREEIFRKGYYYYAGSAHGSGGLYSRLMRHCSHDKKKHWHIDYFLEHAKLVNIFTWATGKDFEHELAGMIGALDGVQPAATRFGSSDCRCGTHLLYASKNDLQIQLQAIAGLVHKCCIHE